jgi:hypothetical protein
MNVHIMRNINDIIPGFASLAGSDWKGFIAILGAPMKS